MDPEPGLWPTNPIRVTCMRSELAIKGHGPFRCDVRTPLGDVHLEWADDLSRFMSLLGMFQKNGLNTSSPKLLNATCLHLRVRVLGPYDDTVNACGNNGLGTRWSVNSNTAWLKRHIQISAIGRCTCLGKSLHLGMWSIRRGGGPSAYDLTIAYYDRTNRGAGAGTALNTTRAGKGLLHGLSIIYNWLLRPLPGS